MRNSAVLDLHLFVTLWAKLLTILTSKDVHLVAQLIKLHRLVSFYAGIFAGYTTQLNFQKVNWKVVLGWVGGSKKIFQSERSDVMTVMTSK